MCNRLIATVPLVVLLASPAFAQRLPTVVLPEHYDLKFTVDLRQARFWGTETIDVQVANPTATVVLHALDIQFQEVSIGAGPAAQKAAVTLNDSDQTATLTVAQALPQGRAQIHIRYIGILNDKLRGF